MTPDRSRSLTINVKTDAFPSRLKADFWCSPDAPVEDPRKIPAEKIYTDGCGFMNGVALKTIKDTLGLNQVPCAVQGRIFGSKGVWMLHPDHTDFDSGDCPRIWIRRRVGAREATLRRLRFRRIAMSTKMDILTWCCRRSRRTRRSGG